MFHGTKILAVGCHPDEIEFGTIGTLLKYRKSIRELHCYIATVGGEGDASNNLFDRRMEAEKALESLSPDSIICFDQVGLRQSSYPSEVRKLEEIYKKCDADLVLTVGPHDTHQDHRMMSEITLTALRRSRASILFYATPSTTGDFNSRLFVDISQYWEQKIEFLKLHKTQQSKPYMDIEYLKIFHSDSIASLRGMRYVERFEVERLLFYKG